MFKALRRLPVNDGIYAPLGWGLLSAALITLLVGGALFAQEPVSSIRTIQSETRQGDDSAHVGRTVTIEGIVTGVYGGLFFVQEESGPWHGVGVYAAGNSVSVGDRVRVTGTVTEYYDLTEIEEPAEIRVLSSDNPLPAPVPLSVREAAQEQWEGVLVQVTDLTVTSEPDQYGEWRVRDASGTIRVDDKGIFYGADAGESIPAIVAVVDHAFGSYRLIPRALEDIGDIAAAPPPIPTDLTPIYAIQGSGAETPMPRARVDVLGVATAVKADGFFIQDPRGDGDPRTSDGIYVYTEQGTDVAPGDCVLVRQAAVSEYYQKTELSRAERIQVVDACDAQTVAPVEAPPAALNSDPVEVMEPFEGMLVALDDFAGVVQGPTKRFSNGDVEIGIISERFVRYLPGGRVYQNEPGSGSALLFLSNIVGADLPEADWGDLLTVQAAQGGEPVLAVLDYNFGKYQLALLPGQKLVVTGHAPAPDVAVPAGEDAFSVCTFNVYGLGRGNDQYPEESDYAAALHKRATAIAEGLNGCTVIGLQETGTPADADALAATLAEAHDLDYTAVALPGPNSDFSEFPLTNSLLARTDRVTVVMSETRQGCSDRNYDVRAAVGACPLGRYALFNRPPLVVDLLVAGAWGEEPYPLTVIVNHFKSKSGDESVNVMRRTRQAEHVASLVQERLDVDPDAHVVVLGDLNDFYASAPIEAVQSGTDPDLIHPYDLLPPLDRYTYIFNGASQVLDHILITPAMMPEFARIDPVHISADYAVPTDIDPETIFHASDHDPVQMTIRPRGAGWIGGTVLVPGVEVTLSGDDGEAIDTVSSDAGGEFRFWGLQPGDYTVTFAAPDAVTIDAEDEIGVVEAGAGLYLEPAIDHRSARTGSAGAALGAVLVVTGQE